MYSCMTTWVAALETFLTGSFLCFVLYCYLFYSSAYLFYCLMTVTAAAVPDESDCCVSSVLLRLLCYWVL